MKKVFLFYLIISAGLCLAQDALPKIKLQQADPNPTWGHEYYGLRLGFDTHCYGKYSDPVFFQYKSSNSDLIIQRNLDLKKASSIRNINIAYEGCTRNRLYMSTGFSFNPWTDKYFIWNISSGAGYVFSLTADERLLLCTHMDLTYGSYRYRFSDIHYRSEESGIIFDHKDIGDHVNSILFIDRCFAAIPSLKLVYQFEHINLYAGIGYYIPLAKKELICFKADDVVGSKENCATSDYVQDYNGHAIHENIIEDLRFLQANAGMVVRIGDCRHVLKKKVVEW